MMKLYRFIRNRLWKWIVFIWNEREREWKKIEEKIERKLEYTEWRIRWKSLSERVKNTNLILYFSQEWQNAREKKTNKRTNCTKNFFQPNIWLDDMSWVAYDWITLPDDYPLENYYNYSYASINSSALANQIKKWESQLPFFVALFSNDDTICRI